MVRFARHLGFSKFEDLRSAIEERINLDLTSAERLRRLSPDSTSLPTLLNSIIDTSTGDIDALLQQFDEGRMTRFIGALISSQSLIVVGLRWVAPLATYLSFSLGRIRPGVALHTAADSTLYDAISVGGEGAAVVLVALARYPRDAVSIAQFRGQRGAARPFNHGYGGVSPRSIR